MTTTTKTIHVTEEDLRRGRELKRTERYEVISQCPIALALAREFEINRATWGYISGDVGVPCVAKDAFRVHAWVRAYDLEGEGEYAVAPMEFEVTYATD